MVVPRTIFALGIAVGVCGWASGGVIAFGSGSNQFSIEFVEIGSPGNADDTTGSPNRVGRVDYTYQIGKYEISRDMVIKANAAGGLGITLHDMRNFGGNGADRPATNVNWFEAATFVNWLNTSQGYQAAYKFDGSGNFQLWDSGDAGYDPANLYRNSLTNYVLPNVDEWYKAAFYNPNTGTYGDYSSMNGNLPTAVASGTTANTAVYLQPSQQGPADIDLAGGLNSFGVMGMGGNVNEWEETSFDLSNSLTSASRGKRSGHWYSNAGTISSAGRFPGGPEIGISNMDGFRVASLSTSTVVPEPTSFAIFGIGALGMVGTRRRRK